MPAQLAPEIEAQAAMYPAALYPPRKRWTRAECQLLEDTGVWERERLELVEGELISGMGKKRPHVNTQARVAGWLIRVFGEDFVNAEAPIDVAPADNPVNEPEPDFVVLARPLVDYLSANPAPSDIRLLIEISDTSLSFDLGIKARLYARAGIVDYWVVDVTGRRIIVHRNPIDGRYGDITVYNSEMQVSSLAAPDSSFTVDQAFPRSAALQ